MGNNEVKPSFADLIVFWPVNLPDQITAQVGKFLGLSRLSQRMYFTALREGAESGAAELGELLH